MVGVMKKARFRRWCWALGVLVAAPFLAAAEEKIDWGKLADFCSREARKTDRASPRGEDVFVGKGGIRILAPVEEQEHARMRAFLEANRQRPSPPSAEKIPGSPHGKHSLFRLLFEQKAKGAQPTKRDGRVDDPFGGEWQPGDWNMGAPFAEAESSKKPKG